MFRFSGASRSVFLPLARRYGISLQNENITGERSILDARYQLLLAVQIGEGKHNQNVYGLTYVLAINRSLFANKSTRSEADTTVNIDIKTR